jgi:hypothetical protein
MLTQLGVLGVSAASVVWAMTLVAPILPIAWWSTGGFASDVRRPRVLELEARLQDGGADDSCSLMSGIKDGYSFCKFKGIFLFG